jgi:hypothetical protein
LRHVDGSGRSIDFLSTNVTIVETAKAIFCNPGAVCDNVSRSRRRATLFAVRGSIIAVRRVSPYLRAASSRSAITLPRPSHRSYFFLLFLFRRDTFSSSLDGCEFPVRISLAGAPERPVISGGAFECSAYPPDTKSCRSTPVLRSIARGIAYTHARTQTYTDGKEIRESGRDLRKYFDVTRFPLQLSRCISTYTHPPVSIYRRMTWRYREFIRHPGCSGLRPAGVYVRSRH